MGIAEIYRNMLIYAVDDDAINLKLLKAILLQNGFNQLEVFFSGEALMERLTINKPDLILLDIMMPGISGYDVLRHIKGNVNSSQIPVIMITAAPLEEELEPLQMSFELGAMDYISKPFTAIELIMRIQSALKLEKQRQDLEAATAHISTLEKLLPICSYCKKVRSDLDYWEEVEVYISQHTDTMFSHSICPDCYQTHVKPQLSALCKKKLES